MTAAVTRWLSLCLAAHQAGPTADLLGVLGAACGMAWGVVGTLHCCCHPVRSQEDPVVCAQLWGRVPPAPLLALRLCWTWGTLGYVSCTTLCSHSVYIVSFIFYITKLIERSFVILLFFLIFKDLFCCIKTHSKCVLIFKIYISYLNVILLYIANCINWASW